MLKNKIQFLSLLSFLILTSVLISDLSAQDKFKYEALGKRDPFIALVTPDGRLLKLEQEDSDSALLLEGIIYDKFGLSYAVVNGEVVKIGERVAGYQVLKIKEQKVIFIKDGQALEIELKKEE
jgi:hypothetical protein